MVNNKISDMKQTAVEWLYKNLLENPISNQDVEYNEAVFHNAKEMEAEQRAKIRLEGYGEGYDEGLYDALNK